MELISQDTDTKPSYQELVAQLEEKNVLFKYLEEENHAFRAENFKLKSELNPQQTGGDGLKRMNADFDDDSNQAKRARSDEDDQLQAAKQENDELERKLTDAKQEIVELKDKLNEEEQCANELSEQNVELQCKLNESQKYADMLKIRVNSQDQYVENANEQLAELQREVVGLKAKLSDYDSEQIAELQRKLIESQKETDEVKAKFVEANSVNKAANRDLRIQLKDLTQEIISLENQLAELRSGNRIVQDQSTHANDTSEFTLEAQLIAKQKGVDKLLLKLEDLTSNFVTKCQENAKLIKKIDTSEKHRNQLVKDLNNQGGERFNNKQYEEALELRLKAVGIEECGRKSSYWLAATWSNISMCWFGLERHEKALEAIEKAISFNNTKPTYFYNRGIYYKTLGNQERAVEDFEKAIALDPNYETAKAKLIELRQSSVVVT